MRKIATQAGRHLATPRIPLFAHALREADIPVGNLTHRAQYHYHFTLERLTPQASHILLTHPELSEQKASSAISQVSGKPQLLPSVHVLTQTDTYRPLGALLRSLGLHKNRSEINFSSLQTPIFSRQRDYTHYYYPSSLEDQLIAELTRRH